MDPLPAEFEALIKSFNEQMSALFVAFLQQMSVGQSLQGDVFALTGRQDCHFDLMAGDIVKPLNKDVSFDQSLMSVFGYPRADHRGNNVNLPLFFGINMKTAPTGSENDPHISLVWGMFHKRLRTAD